MALKKAEAAKSLYSLELHYIEVVFLFLGYSGIFLRTKNAAIAVDLGRRSLGQPEPSAIEHLDLLLFTHNHWDHYGQAEALGIICQTNAHAIADTITLEELKAKIPPNRLTIGDSGPSSISY